jgi:hypothetical protein
MWICDINPYVCQNQSAKLILAKMMYVSVSIIPSKEIFSL